MTTRQYVGARYVPIIANPVEWSNTNTYEPLTIVTYQGNSYTSRQFVPAGTDINNTSYWANTGNYNAQIEQYRNDVSRVSEEINDLDDSVTERMTTLTERVDATVENFEKSILGFDIYTCSDGDGSFTLCISENTAICIDAGSTSGDSVIFRNILSTILDDKLLSGIIITHFHPDHMGHFNILADFAAADCLVFEQMSPSESNSQYNTYLSGRTQLHEYFPNSVVPQNNNKFTIGDFAVRIFNTDINSISTYESVLSESDRLENGLNAYSLLCEISMGENVYFHTSDAECCTQRLNTQYVKKCNIMSTPHHGVNHNGYEDFYTAASPDIFILTNRVNKDTKFNSESIGRFYTLRYGYIHNISLIVTQLNYSKTRLVNGQYNLERGFIDGLNPSDTYNFSIEITTGLTYVSDDPFFLTEYSANELLNQLRLGFNVEMSFTRNTNIWGKQFDGITEIYTKLKDLPDTVRVYKQGNYMILGNINARNTIPSYFIGATADVDTPSSHALTKLSSIYTPSYKHQFTPPYVASTDVITDSFFFDCLTQGVNNVWVELNSNAEGTGNKCVVFLTPSDLTQQRYRGVQMNGSLTELYGATIVNRVFNGFKYSLNDQTAGQMYVAAYGIGTDKKIVDD